VAKLKVDLKNLIPVAIAVASATVAMAAVTYVRFVHQADQFVRDYETAVLSKHEPQSSDITIVAISEQTLKLFPYREPVDRKFLSDLLKKLAEWKPRAIALDVLFDLPSDPVKDDELRSTIANLPVPLVVSYVGNLEIVERGSGQDYLNAFVPLEDRVRADIPTDPFDGTARWVEPGFADPDGPYIPGFSRGLLRKIGINTPEEKAAIAWRGYPDNKNDPPFRQIAADSVVNFKPALAEKFLKPAIAGKIVLVGADYSLTDRHRTPFATVYEGNQGILPGIVIHAHSLDGLLSDRRPPGLGDVIDFVSALFLASLGATLGIAKIPLQWRIVLGTVVAATWWVGGGALFHYTGVMLTLVIPTMSMATAMWGTEAVMGHEARQQKEFIQGVFSRYVSPKVVGELIRDPAKLTLEGERRAATFLFTDVAGFTTMSEAVTGAKLAEILNRYLDGMVRVIQQHDGLVDKFIGDAVFAMFNVPLDQPDHYERAVRCALELDRYAEKFRAEQNAAGVPFGVTRIGVHSGHATVGNFGSHDKMEYTALGDAVNTASRLEGLNKYFGTRTCVSEVTHAECKGIPFRPMGMVIVKGKTQALGVFEPLSEERAGSDYVKRYLHAYQHLEQGAEDTLALFEDLFAENPYDGCVEIHLERLRAGERSPEIAMTEK
jgi:class 3 adenylate cyclase/CHASE2 domain-containing sensor protein